MTTKGVTRTPTSRPWLRRWAPWFFHSRVGDAIFPPMLGPLTTGALIFWPLSLALSLLRQAPIFAVWITVMVVFSGYVDLQKARSYRIGYLSGRAVGHHQALGTMLMTLAAASTIAQNGSPVSERDPPPSDTHPSA